MPRGRAFQPGHSGNPRGRPKGVPNEATREIREFARSVLERQEVRAAHLTHLTEHPDGALAQFLYGHAYGKPVERVEQGGPGAFASLSDDELRERLEEALRQL